MDPDEEYENVVFMMDDHSADEFSKIVEDMEVEELMEFFYG